MVTTIVTLNGGGAWAMMTVSESGNACDVFVRVYCLVGSRFAADDEQGFYFYLENLCGDTTSVVAVVRSSYCSLDFSTELAGLGDPLGACCGIGYRILQLFRRFYQSIASLYRPQAGL